MTNLTTDERSQADVLANRLLDEPNCDPDDDLRVLARQLLRRQEEVERLHLELAFIGGYLLEHRQMLKDNGVHPKIVDAVLWLEKRIAEL